MTSVYGVAGNPVFGSRSPVMFNTAFRHLGLDAVYVRLAASTAAEAMDAARQIGMAGLNVTTPFKTETMRLLDAVDGYAGRVGAVNTIVRTERGFEGFNTDVQGVLSALGTAGLSLCGKKAVVIGAGGAAAAAAFALVSAGASVVLANRTFGKAQEVASRLGCEAASLPDVPAALAGASLLVSAVPTTDRVVDPEALFPGLVVLDAVYGKPTALSKDAAGKGCAFIDGRQWLLGQAAPAFGLFTGRPAPSAVMGKALFKTRRDARSNIALVGLPASGKSVVGRELSAISGLPFVDIDGEIERKAGAPISGIFARGGEGEFRRMEQEEIDGIRLLSGTVVACGGGALQARPNVRTLRNNCLTVWLWADVPTVIARADKESGRPLFDGIDEDKARALLSARLPGYAACSDLVVTTEGKGPEEVARRIWDEVRDSLGG